MRRIGDIQDARQADRLSDVLRGHGIANDVRDDGDGAFDVWVHDDAQLKESVQIFEAFVAQPDDPAFADAASRGKAMKRDAEKKDVAYQRRIALAQRSMLGADGRGYITLAVMALAIGVAVFTDIGGAPQRLSALWFTTAPPAMGLPEIRGGEVWRLVTPMLMHFGYMHLFFNLYMWFSFAQMVELRKGEAWFVVFLLTSAAFSNGVQFGWDAFTSPHSLSVFGGLSGVLYALFGYAWIKGRIDALDQIGVPDQTVTLLLGWLVLCMTGIMGPIANGAHVGGLVFGVVAAYLDVAWFRWQKGRG